VPLAALDWNSNRVWAVVGEAGKPPQVAHLDDDRPELALVLSLAERRPRVGQAGLALVRRSPHLSVSGFLHQMGETTEWSVGRHRIRPDDAVALACKELRRRLPELAAVALAVPDYLKREQVHQLVRAAQAAGLPVVGAVSRGLAAALSSYADHPWYHVGLLVDADEHALVCAVFRPTEDSLQLLGQRTFALLGLRHWREKLIAAVAEQSIRVSRRDPRASSDADQSLFDQLDRVLDACSQGKAAELELNAIAWRQKLALEPETAVRACGVLSRVAAEEVAATLVWAEQQLASVTIYLTAQAARLPGLAGALYWRTDNRVPLVVLPPSAPALAAFALAERIERRELMPAFFERDCPLPHVEPRPASELIPFPSSARRAALE